MKNLRKTALATGLALAAGAGFSGQAFAGIYAGSSLLIDDLSINFIPTFIGSSPDIGQFDFTTSANAALVPGGFDAEAGACSGNLGTPSTTCNTGAGPVLYNNLSGGDPAVVGATPTPLDAQPINTVTHLGPAGVAGTADYAYADAIIDEATLVDATQGVFGTTTSTRQISESEISSAEQAFSNTDISSTTSFTYLFNLEGSGDLLINFLADPYLLAQFDDATATDATASADMEFTFTLTSSDAAAGALSVTWTPETVGGGCADNVSALGSVGCASETTTQNLNDAVTAPGPLPFSEDAYSVAGGFTAFGVQLTGLTSGNYSLVLNGKTASSVTRVAIPAPATLLLFGAGLTMLGFGTRRRKAS